MTQIHKQNVPKLRFSGFEKAWEDHLFDSFLIPDFRAQPKPSENYLSLGVRSHGRGVFQKPNADPQKIAMDTLYKVHASDLIVNITFAWEGAIAIAKSQDHGGLVSHRFPTYTFEREKVIPTFFEYIIENRRFRQTLDLISPGGAGRNRVLSKSAFLKIKHLFPTLPEQRKIASFLGSMDEKIAQLSRKKALLEDYKKGCMQQLFSQKIRFKDDDGNDFPDWEKKRLGEIATFSSGKNIKQAEASPEFQTPCVRYGELYHMYREVIRDVVNKTNLPVSDLRFSIGNEVLVPSAGEDPLDIGSASALTIKGVAIGRTINIITPKKEDLYFPIFLSYYINSVLRKRISCLARGSSISNVYNSDLKTLVIYLPTFSEQRKIADFLSALDTKIDLVGQELIHARSFKAGLLQQMFV